MAQMTLAIIGGGNLGTAIALGAAKEKVTPAKNITITRRHTLIKANGVPLSISMSS